MIKKLYSFSVKKPIISKVEEKTSEGTLVKEVVTSETKECFIKYPGRKERDSLQIVFAGEFGKLLTAGVQTNETIRKSILDSGGFTHAKTDIEWLEQVLPSLNEKRNLVIKNKIENIECSELEKEVSEIEKSLIDLDSRFSNVFHLSAESIANQNMLLYATIHYLFWEDGSPVFPGQTDETITENYYRIFDEEDASLPEMQAFAIAYPILEAHLLKNWTKEDIEERMKNEE